jgi:hypothetical protein
MEEQGSDSIQRATELLGGKPTSLSLRALRTANIILGPNLGSRRQETGQYTFDFRHNVWVE